MSTTKIHSPRAGRHQARRILWTLSALPRVRSCFRSAAGESGSVALKVAGSGDSRRAGFAGVAVCGSTWACPCCSAKISAGRADELSRVFAQWRSMGGEVDLLTLTMRHKRGQSLKSLWDAVGYAWGKVTSGRAWKAEQELAGIVGWVRVVEVTHGVNGWHVHIHAAILRDPRNTLWTVEAQGAAMFARWSRALERKGFDAPIAEFGGLDIKTLQEGAGALAGYFNKHTYETSTDGWELAGGMGKQARGANRTPFEVLRDVTRYGLVDDVDLWHEWERGSKGRRQLTWSRGLRARFAVVERSDEEIAEADELKGSVLVRLLDWPSTRGVSETLLDLAECDDTGEAVKAYLDRHSLPWAGP